LFDAKTLHQLPTKFNLLHRGIIQANESSCVAGCGIIETAQHLFITCDFLVRYGGMPGYGLVLQVLIIML
jgi:hypothetical protein